MSNSTNGPNGPIEPNGPKGPKGPNGLIGPNGPNRPNRPIGRSERAYIGCYTSAGGPGITTASVDPCSGALAVLHATDEVADPSFLALAPAGDRLYAVSETADGAAAALDLAGDADRPALLGAAVTVRGDEPTHLSVVGRRLLTANYGSGSVTVLPIRDDGSLGTPSDVRQHRGSGPDQDRQAGPHAHAVLPDPTGRWILSVDLGTDSVRVSAVDADAPSHGGVAPPREVRLRPGSGPRHLTFHPRGDRAYVVNELAPTVTACRWDPTVGELEPLGETRVLPGEGHAGPQAKGSARAASGGDAAADSAAVYPSEVVVAPDGRFAWVAVRGTDALAILALDPDGDAPRLVGQVPSGGHWPRHLTLEPSGRRLYVSHVRSGDVTWFDVDATTGRPHRAGSLSVPAASCVVFR